MRRRKNATIAYNPHSLGLGDSLVAVFVMGIIVLSLMWYFKKSFFEIGHFCICDLGNWKNIFLF